MKWWLSVFFLLNGAWVPGHEIQQLGWSPRPYRTEEECKVRKKFAEKSCKHFRVKTAWFCKKGTPLIEAPQNLYDIEC